MPPKGQDRLPTGWSICVLLYVVDFLLDESESVKRFKRCRSPQVSWQCWRLQPLVSPAPVPRPALVALRFHLRIAWIVRKGLASLTSFTCSRLKTRNACSVPERIVPPRRPFAAVACSIADSIKAFAHCGCTRVPLAVEKLSPSRGIFILTLCACVQLWGQKHEQCGLRRPRVLFRRKRGPGA